MPTLKELRNEHSVATSKLVLINEQIAEKVAKTVIACESNCAYGDGCGQKFFIKNLEYIQTHYYERPWGCTGGDTWHQGEGQFTCPCCGHRNRFLDRKEFEGLKYSFKKIVDEHKD